MIDLTTLTLDDMERILRGYQSISFAEFASIVEDTCGAGDEYAGHVWNRFQSHPIAYCASRGPRSQGERLTELALRKAQYPERVR